MPHQKAEDLASCYSYDYVCWHDLVYQMYLTEEPTGRCTGRWWHNGNTFIEVEWLGAWNEPRIELLERPFVHSCLASKKGKGVHITQVFIPVEFQLMT